MQQIYSDEPHIINRKRKSHIIRTYKPNRILIFIAVLSLLVFGGAICYACISGKNLNEKKSEYYYVQFLVSDSLSDAQVRSEEIKTSGGSGFIINDNGFRVTAAVYKSKTDAESVAAKQNGDVGVYKLTIPKIKLNKFDLADVNNGVKKGLGIYSEVYNAIFPILIDYDSGVQSESVLMTAVINTKTYVRSYKQEFMDICKNENNSIISLISEHLSQIENLLNDAVTQKENTFSVRVKYALSDMLYQRADFSLNVNSLSKT